MPLYRWWSCITESRNFLVLLFCRQIFSPMAGDSLTSEHNASLSLEQNATRDEKPIRKERQRELIFPCTYKHPRHLQYATHFPIPQVSRHFQNSKGKMLIGVTVAKGGWQINNKKLPKPVIIALIVENILLRISDEFYCVIFRFCKAGLCSKIYLIV